MLSVRTQPQEPEGIELGWRATREEPRDVGSRVGETLRSDWPLRIGGPDV